MALKANNSQWGVTGPWAENVNAGSTVYGGGGDPMAMSAAARLDRVRMGDGQLPDAQYPDGFLGSVQSRTTGRTDEPLNSRLSDRAYQRGVHKATKMPAEAYLWPTDFGPMSGLELEAQARYDRAEGVFRAQKWGSPGDPVEAYLAGAPVNDEQMADVYRHFGLNPQTMQGPDVPDPVYRAAVAHIAPPFSW